MNIYSYPTTIVVSRGKSGCHESILGVVEDGTNVYDWRIILLLNPYKNNAIQRFISFVCESFLMLCCTSCTSK